jgi:hypothetical protein
MEAHPRAVETHPESFVVHPGDVEGLPVDMEIHQGAVETFSWSCGG